MKEKLVKIYKHPFFTGSALMIIGTNIGNVFAYLFHLIIGRMLGPSGYGELAAVISLVGLLSVSYGFLGLVIVKFVSEMNQAEATSFFAWVNKWSLITAGIFSVIILFISRELSLFLNISLSSAFISAPLLFVLFISFIYTSFLQGLLRFGKLALSTGLSLFFRLILGVLFVYVGFSVFGALAGVLLSSILGLFIALFFIRDYWHGKKIKFKFRKSKEVFAYAVPIFIMSLTTNSMYMSDVVLVKHFFDPHLAGIYASLSTMGKIIFYGTAPVAAVMFPLVSKTRARGGNYKRVFFLSVIITSLMVVGLVAIYWLFPNLVLQILYGNKFIEGATYLVWFGIFIGLFALSSLFLSYFLSKGTTKPVYLGLLGAILQITGILIFHKNITEVISVSIWVSLILLVTLVIYFAYEKDAGKKVSLSGSSGLQSGEDN